MFKMTSKTHEDIVVHKHLLFQNYSHYHRIHHRRIGHRPLCWDQIPSVQCRPGIGHALEAIGISEALRDHLHYHDLATRQL